MLKIENNQKSLRKLGKHTRSIFKIIMSFIEVTQIIRLCVRANESDKNVLIKTSKLFVYSEYETKISYCARHRLHAYILSDSHTIVASVPRCLGLA